jgi:hypothetical protein
MEYVTGTTMIRLLSRGPLPDAEGVRVGTQRSTARR